MLTPAVIQGVNDALAKTAAVSIPESTEKPVQGQHVDAVIGVYGRK